MDFASTALYPAYYEIYVNTTGGTPERRIPAIAAAAQPRLTRALEVLEGELARREWLAGASFTAADIALAAVLHTLRERLGFDSAAYQSTIRWWMRVAERPAWRRCVE
jgi:glutathione S-transferase